MRESMLRPSTERLLSFPVSCVTMSSRFLSFMRQPSSTLLFCFVFSPSSFSMSSS